MPNKPYKFIGRNKLLQAKHIAVYEENWHDVKGSSHLYDVVRSPDAVVIVATIRALKMHGGVAKEDLKKENVDALKKGLVNLERHINNTKKFNLPVVVAVNHFITDADKEVNTLINDICVKQIPQPAFNFYDFVMIFTQRSTHYFLRVGEGVVFSDLYNMPEIGFAQVDCII